MVSFILAHSNTHSHSHTHTHTLAHTLTCTPHFSLTPPVIKLQGIDRLVHFSFVGIETKQTLKIPEVKIVVTIAVIFAY